MNEASQHLADFNAQTRIEPGTLGWWPIWGGCTQDIRPGDIIRFSDRLSFVSDLAYIEDPLLRMVQFSWIDQNGERRRIGRGFTAFLVYRKATGNILSDYVR